MPRVEVVNLSSVPVRRRVLIRAAQAAIRTEKKAPSRVVIAVVPDSRMRQLHRRAFADRSTTDVLAWPPGEIAVCVDTARRESARRGHALHAELALYVVHGILHLAGHDDHARRPRERMWRRQREILSGLGLDLRN